MRNGRELPDIYDITAREMPARAVRSRKRGNTFRVVVRFARKRELVNVHVALQDHREHRQAD
jgi:hypothetical protein